jgi:hypothetical protein
VRPRRMVTPAVSALGLAVASGMRPGVLLFAQSKSAGMCPFRFERGDALPSICNASATTLVSREWKRCQEGRKS